MRPPRALFAHVERRKEGEEGGLIGIPSPHCPTRSHTPRPSAAPHLASTLPLYMPPSTPRAYALACRLTCPRPVCLFCVVHAVNSTYFDQRLDTNHDGVLTIDELAATIAELDADDADSETAASIAKRADVRLLLRTADANGDGQVTWDEFGERFAYMDDSERYSSAVRWKEFENASNVDTARTFARTQRRASPPSPSSLLSHLTRRFAVRARALRPRRRCPSRCASTSATPPRTW